MRHLALITAGLMLAAASPAAAQHTSGAGTPMGDLMDLNRFVTRGFMNQWAATRPAALAGLTRDSRRWIRDEVHRQATAPRDPVEVALDIDRVMGEDLDRMARGERAEPEQIASAVLLKIMADTKNALAREARRADGAPQPGQPAWDVRIAQAEANLETTVELASSLSVSMARD